MNEKQSKNREEGFWSGSDESDEDFETLMGISKVKNEIIESLSDLNKVNNDVKDNSVPTLNELSDTDDEKEEYVGLFVNSTSNEKTSTLFENNIQQSNQEVQMPSEEANNTIFEESNIKILPAETMDFLWDDDDDEEVFIKPVKQQENTEKEKPDLYGMEYGSLDDLNSLSTQNFDLPSISSTQTIENEEKMFISSEIREEEGSTDEENEEITVDYDDKPFSYDKIKDKIVNYEEEKSINYTKVEYKAVNYVKKDKTIKKDKIVKKDELTKSLQNDKNPLVKPFPNIPRPNQKISESKPKKFDFNFQTPRVLFLNRFVLTYCTIKQKRRNQQGEYIEKEVNIINSYEYNFNPILNSSLTVDISQICDDYKTIKEILELKDAHVDNICEILGVKNVSYSQNSYSEKYDSSDVNTLIDLALEDKEMAIDYACKKSMWSFALLCSGNRPDIIRKFLMQTCKNEMVELALSVFNNEDLKEINLSPNWSEYLKHILRLPFGEIHLKLIQKLYNEDKNNLYVLLVSLHLLKIVNIGDLMNFYPRNFYFMKILLFLDQKFPVNNLNLLLYQYITILYDFDKIKAEEIYKLNKKRFNNEMQTALDQTFNVAGWGFGLKEVINFGISKILNVEDEEIKSKKSFEIKNKIIPVKNREIERRLGERNTIKNNPIKNQINKTYGDEPLENNETLSEININEKPLSPKSKTVIVNNDKPLYSDQQHAKSFADIMDLEKPQKEITTEDDTSLFLSKYNIDDNEAGLRKPVEEKKEENSSSFFSMFNFFKKTKL